MFNAKLMNSKTFKDIVKALKLVNEATFKVTADRIILSEMDAAKVAIVELDLPSSAFDSYSCDEDISFKVDIGALLAIVKRIKSDDIVTMMLKDNSLKIKLQGKVARTFSILVEEPDSVKLRESNIQYTAEIKLLPDLLKDAIKDVTLVSEYTEFYADKTHFLIQASSHIGINEAQIELLQDAESILDYNVSEVSKAIYAINYLKDMLDIAGSADLLTLSFATNNPLRLEYMLPGYGIVRYYLAPKREDDML